MSANVQFRTGFESEDQYLTFYSKSADINARQLSNFSDHSLCISYEFVGYKIKCMYPTGEHAFQGGKFMTLSLLLDESSSRREELQEYSKLFQGNSLRECELSTPGAAKSAGGRRGLPLSEDELVQWSHYSIIFQELICREKMKYNEILEYLLSTRDKYLVHFERATGWPRYGAMILKAENSPFGDGRRWVKGDNVLGETWMTLRSELDSK